MIEKIYKPVSDSKSEVAMREVDIERTFDVILDFLNTQEVGKSLANGVGSDGKFTFISELVDNYIPSGDYERNHSHIHCWDRTQPSACGMPMEKHTQCCLCDTKVPQEEGKGTGLGNITPALDKTQPTSYLERRIKEVNAIVGEVLVEDIIRQTIEGVLEEAEKILCKKVLSLPYTGKTDDDWVRISVLRTALIGDK